MNVLMFAQFTLNLIVQVGLSYILGTFHILQIVCFQTMVNIEYPANAQFAASTIIDILNADVLQARLPTRLAARERRALPVAEHHPADQGHGLHHVQPDSEPGRPLRRISAGCFIICRLWMPQGIFQVLEDQESTNSGGRRKKKKNQN
jgi:hypothetical protein